MLDTFAGLTIVAAAVPVIGRRSEAGDRKKKPERRWAPRIWVGSDFFAWLRLLARNRFAVGPAYLYIAWIDTATSALNTLLRWVQEARYGRRVRETEIRQAPIFIIGHWRTGTTLVHELLALDPRHTCPTNYQCLSPNHFLITGRCFPRWFWFLMPARRPMDDMATGWERPQEDEFAMCNLGQLSPYLTIAFPNGPRKYAEYWDLEGISRNARQRWKDVFMRFLKQVTLNDPRRIVLKSPPHTFRIRVLLELFPRARFVNVVRDPYTVFPSTVNMWKWLYRTHGLQRPRFEGLEEYVLETFARMHEKLEETRPLVDPSRFCDLRYEDLVRDPIGQMEALYDHLGLEEFDRVRPAMEEYLESVADYQPNRYELSPEQRAEVTQRWAPYFARYGYSGELEGAAAFQGEEGA